MPFVGRCKPCCPAVLVIQHKGTRGRERPSFPMMSFWRIFGWPGRDSSPRGKRVWLFYSGPENYRDKHGERDLTSGRFLWSCAKGTAKGDLALLYRRSLTGASIKEMINEGLISQRRAEEL